MVMHKAEMIETECIKRKMDKIYIRLEEVNAEALSIFPPCVRDVILREIAYEVTMRKLDTSAQRN